MSLSLSLSGTRYSSIESSTDGSEMQCVTAAHSSNHALYGKVLRVGHRVGDGVTDKWFLV